MFDQLFGGSRSALVEAAFADVSRMLHLSAEMLDHSLAVLFENRPLAVDLEDMDDLVDAAERSVRRTILQHLAVNPRQDLVASLVLVSMVQDAERIGDFARGIVELVKMARGPREGPFCEELEALAARMRPLFDECEKAFREADAAAARRVIVAHRGVRDDLKAYRQRVAASDLRADMAVIYAGSAQILRRVSAHLSNIASTVVQPYDLIRHGSDDIAES
jgi:phosphate uptake regulator